MNPLAWLEADMARHMLVEFPLLFALGAVIGHYAPGGSDGAYARIDRFGLTGWTFASLVLAFWMIPIALDAAIGSAAVNALKYTSLVAAGFALRRAMIRSPQVLEAFFVGNLVWMSATLGLIYQESPRQLCLNYLVDAQVRAGTGLVTAALVVGGAWFYVAYVRGPRANGRRFAFFATSYRSRFVLGPTDTKVQWTISRPATTVQNDGRNKHA